MIEISIPFIYTRSCLGFWECGGFNNLIHTNITVFCKFCSLVCYTQFSSHCGKTSDVLGIIKFSSHRIKI